jgi:exodeoxyribonuclease V alpha subunit
MARRKVQSAEEDGLQLELRLETAAVVPVALAEERVEPVLVDAEGFSRGVLLGALGFSALDLEFAAFLEQQGLGTRGAELLWLGGALVSRARGRGFGYLRLEMAPEDWPEGEGWPRLADWREALGNSRLVAGEEEEAEGDGEGDEARPLTLARGGEVLYLSRYWRAERFIARELRRRAEVARPLTTASPREIARVLDEVFEKAAPPGEIDWQRAAILLMLRRGFLVLSGGPGTGKTRVASFLLRALELLPPGPGRVGQVRVALAAPTGKAAARLQESVGAESRDRVRLGPASTLHRLLGGNREGRPFRYGPGHPLGEELVVLDECSMVDLLLMEQLLRALPEGAGLFLLGDKDQLAPVEVGGFLAELGRMQAGENALDAAARADLEEAFGPGLPWTEPAAERPVMLMQLQRNFRFAEGDGIHALSQAIRAGRVEAVLELLARAEAEPGSVRGLAARRFSAGRLGTAVSGLEALAREWFGGWGALPGPEAAMVALGSRRVLAPTRAGTLGVVALNGLVQRALGVGGRVFYAGRPVLVLRNDYALRVFNGETGLVLPEENGERLKVWFPQEDSGKGRERGLRGLAPVRLPVHETAYAMTVHKSQGSEFTEVALVLPEMRAEVLCRELVYTAVTRAREAAHVWYEPEVLRWALSREGRRTSLLGD